MDTRLWISGSCGRGVTRIMAATPATSTTLRSTPVTTIHARLSQTCRVGTRTAARPDGSRTTRARSSSRSEPTTIGSRRSTHTRSGRIAATSARTTRRGRIRGTGEPLTWVAAEIPQLRARASIHRFACTGRRLAGPSAPMTIPGAWMAYRVPCSCPKTGCTDNLKTGSTCTILRMDRSSISGSSEERRRTVGTDAAKLLTGRIGSPPEWSGLSLAHLHG